MKLVATVQLLCPAEEKARLLATMERVNEACNWLAERAFAEKTSDKLRLQRDYYSTLREKFGLSSQMVVRLISKVCEAYKRDRKKRPTFKPHGAIAYDQRLYRFPRLDRLSLATLEKRLVVPVAVGPYHKARLEGARGQADLVYRKGKLYFFVTVEVPDGSPIDVEGTLGGDLGIRNLLSDSDGKRLSGERVEKVRARHAKLRAALQSRGTKSARRRLKKLAGQEARFRADTNHCISKEFVAKTKGTARRIALEDLSGIRERVTVRGGEQRSRLHGWAFYQLRAFIAYKALLAGVPVVLVDPRNTSRECPGCGYTAKENRKSQAEFQCLRCGFAAHADLVGATNIARRANVNSPIVPKQVRESVTHPGTSLRSSGASPVL